MPSAQLATLEQFTTLHLDYLPEHRLVSVTLWNPRFTDCAVVALRHALADKTGRRPGDRIWLGDYKSGSP